MKYYYMVTFPDSATSVTAWSGKRHQRIGSAVNEAISEQGLEDRRTLSVSAYEIGPDGLSRWLFDMDPDGRLLAATPPDTPRARTLIQRAAHALNACPNQRMDYEGIRDSYEVASELGSYLRGEQS